MSEHHHEKHLEVIVHYPAVKKPFEEKHAGRKETLSTLKSTALKAFGLPEGEVDGKTYTYTLYYYKTPLENLSETLGQLAGNAESLMLKLSQQVTQG